MKEIDIDNLRQYIKQNGNRIKDYKKLTEILNTDYTSNTDRKKKRLEEFKNYFSWRMLGREFIIEEIYDTPYRPISTRKTGYKHNIGEVLSALIESSGTYQNINGRKTKVLCLSRTALMVKLGFVNPRYNKSRIAFRNQNIEENAEIHEDFVSEWNEYSEDFLGDGQKQMDKDKMQNWFYEETARMAYRNIRDNMKAFTKENKIMSVEGYEIGFRNKMNSTDSIEVLQIFEDEVGYSKVLDCEEEALQACTNKINEGIKKDNEWRIQNGEKEKSLIRTLTMSDTRKRQYSHMFREELERKFARDFISEENFLVYYRKAYKMYLHEDFVHKELENTEILNCKLALNDTYIKSVFSRFVKTHERYPEKIDEQFWDVIDVEKLADIEGVSEEDFKDTHIIIDNGIYKKDVCYNEYDLGRLQLLLAMLVCLTPDKMIGELSKKKNLQKKLKTGECCVRNME